MCRERSLSPRPQPPRPSHPEASRSCESPWRASGRRLDAAAAQPPSSRPLLPPSFELPYSRAPLRYPMPHCSPTPSVRASRSCSRARRSDDALGAQLQRPGLGGGARGLRSNYPTRYTGGPRCRARVRISSRASRFLNERRNVHVIEQATRAAALTARLSRHSRELFERKRAHARSRSAV